MADTILNIVDEHDVIIGQAFRSQIHATGLLHREIHVWFITPDRQVIFQKRSMSKETNPGRLTTAVGGHVELGQSYEEAALSEIAEETGLQASSKDLVYFDKIPTEIIDRKIHNRSFRALFGFVCHAPLDTLQVEENDGAGFVAMAFDDVLNLSPTAAQAMSPNLIDREFMLVKDRLLALVA